MENHITYAGGSERQSESTESSLQGFLSVFNFFMKIKKKSVSNSESAAITPSSNERTDYADNESPVWANPFLREFYSAENLQIELDDSIHNNIDGENDVGTGELMRPIASSLRAESCSESTALTDKLHIAEKHEQQNDTVNMPAVEEQVEANESNAEQTVADVGNGGQQMVPIMSFAVSLLTFLLQSPKTERFFTTLPYTFVEFIDKLKSLYADDKASSAYENGTFNSTPIKEIFCGGCAYVINHEIYHRAARTRQGSSKDVEMLCSTFQQFGMAYKIIESPTMDEVNSVLQEIRQRNFDHYTSLMIVILSHGGSGDMLEACDGKAYSLNDVETKLLRNPSLAKKPKILLTAACKGEDTVRGRDEDSIREHGLPTNLLKMHSTFEGYKSTRIAEQGTVFISKFTELTRQCSNTRLGDLPTFVGREVIKETESWRNSDRHGRKKVIQVPTATSTMYD